MWQTSQVLPALTTTEIQVYLLDLRQDRIATFPWQDNLSDQEILQFQKILVPHERQVRIAARSMLRMLLAEYLAQAAKDIEFTINEYGKPSVRHETKLSFNVSHSAPLIVAAFAIETPIGIDIELQRDDFAYMNIAKRMFNEQMYLQLQQLPEEKRLEGFFSLWTTVEAYLKGRGLSLAHYSKEMSCQLEVGSNQVADRMVQVAGIEPWEIYQLAYAKETVISLASPARKKISKWLFQPKLSI